MIPVKRLLIPALLLFFSLPAVMLLAQTSIWQDHNPFSGVLQPGQIIKVDVRENFNIDTNDKWQSSAKTELKLYPDTKNLPFLKSSEQSTNRTDNTDYESEIDEEWEFSMPVTIGQREADGRYPVAGSRQISLDDRTLRVQMNGYVEAADVTNDRISSSRIADLVLTITGKPPFETDDRINLKPPRDEDEEPPPVNTAGLSEQEREQLLLEHLRRILGGLNR